LKPGGRLLLMLRDHGQRGVHAEDLPNPLSRSGDELGATLELLPGLGWSQVLAGARLGRTATLTARR
jgi:hypothetical protein